MSFLTRVRLAIVRWWIRSAEDRRRLQQFDDLEGIGRRLVRPPLREADGDYPAVSTALPVKKEAAFPRRLVIRFEA